MQNYIYVLCVELSLDSSVSKRKIDDAAEVFWTSQARFVGRQYSLGSPKANSYRLQSVVPYKLTSYCIVFSTWNVKNVNPNLSV